jgi:hypothetical protein
MSMMMKRPARRVLRIHERNLYIQELLSLRRQQALELLMDTPESPSPPEPVVVAAPVTQAD